MLFLFHNPVYEECKYNLANNAKLHTHSMHRRDADISILLNIVHHTLVLAIPWPGLLAILAMSTTNKEDKQILERECLVFSPNFTQTVNLNMSHVAAVTADEQLTPVSTSYTSTFCTNLG